ncbi:MAG: hypothetical protein ACI9YL_001078 [Luteibaculaceae bacterium]
MEIGPRIRGNSSIPKKRLTNNVKPLSFSGKGGNQILFFRLFVANLCIMPRTIKTLLLLLLTSWSGLTFGQMCYPPVVSPTPECYFTSVTPANFPLFNYSKFGPANTVGLLNFDDRTADIDDHLDYFRGSNYKTYVQFRIDNPPPGQNSYFLTAYLDYEDDQLSNANTGASFFNYLVFAGSPKVQSFSDSIQFFIPNNTPLGKARLRIILNTSNGGASSSCGPPSPDSKGEVLDFRVNIRCTPNTISNNDFIQEFKLENSRGTVFHQGNSGIGNSSGIANYENNYKNTGYTGDVHQGDMQDFYLRFYGEPGETYYLYTFLDYNNDGGIEQFESHGSQTVASFSNFLDFNSQFMISSAHETPQNARLRVFMTNSPITDPCQLTARGEIHDYKLTVRCPTYEFDYSFLGMTQPDSIRVYPGERQVPVAKFAFRADDGCEFVKYPQSIKFKQGNTTDPADIEHFYIHYNTADDFNSSSVIYDAITAATMTAPLNMNFADGDNFFWISYDVTEIAKPGNKIDALATEFLVGDDFTSIDHINPDENPAGEQIIVYDYCFPQNPKGYARLASLRLDFGTTILVPDSPGFFQFEENDTLLFTGGNTMTFSSGWEDGLENSASFIRVFVDWNFDGDFEDPDERIDLGYVPDGAVNYPLQATLPVPYSMTPGITKLRVVAGPSNGVWGPCDAGVGHFVDFTVRVCGKALDLSQQYICQSNEAVFGLSNYNGSFEWELLNNTTSTWNGTGDNDGFYKTNTATETIRTRLKIDASNIGCPVPTYSSETYGIRPTAPDFTGTTAGDPCNEVPANLIVSYPYRFNLFNDGDTTDIMDGNGSGIPVPSYSKLITSSGVQPLSIDPLSIAKVCVKIAHTDFSQLALDLFQTTSGKRVRLFDFQDFSGAENSELCFTWDGTEPNQSATRGTFKSQDDFRFFNNENANAQWILQVSDNTTGGIGEIQSWRMEFGRFTNTWAPATGLTVTTGDNTLANPNGNTQYTATISDGNCEIPNSYLLNYYVPNVTIKDKLNDTIAICGGANTYVAEVINEQSPNYTYDWFINGVPQGVNNTSFFTTALADDDILKVELTNTDGGCVKSYIDTARAVVFPTLNPAFSFQTSYVKGQSCLGAPLDFEINPVDTGSAPRYTWILNGDTVLQGDTLFSVNGLPQSSQLNIYLEVDDPCAFPPMVIFDTLLTFVQATSPNLSLDHNLRGDSICANERLEFLGDISYNGFNGGMDFQWLLNGVNLNVPTADLVLDTLSGQSDYELVFLATNGLCVVPDSISDTLKFSIAQPSDSYLKIGKSTPFICNGDTGFFKVLDASGFDAGYSVNWYKGNILMTNQNGSSVGIPNFQNNTTVRAEMISDFGCATQIELDSARIQVPTSNAINTAFTIGSDGILGCEGDLISFAEFESKGKGANPTFTWYVNDVQVQTGSGNTFQDQVFGKNDSIYCVLESSHSCALPKNLASNMVYLSLKDTVPASAELSSTEFDLCQGEDALVTVENGVNIGNLPDYRWYVDADRQIGAIKNFYELEDYAPGSYFVYAEVLSGNACARPKVLKTETLNIFVHENPDAKFDFALNPQGGYEFTTRQPNAASWFWSYGELESSTDPNPTFTTNNDTTIIVCQEVTSTFSCVTRYCETISLVSISGDELLAQRIHIYPNPTSENLWIDFQKSEELEIKMVNALGQVLLIDKSKVGEKTWKVSMEEMPSGIYQVIISNQKEKITARVVKR